MTKYKTLKNLVNYTDETDLMAKLDTDSSGNLTTTELNAFFEAAIKVKLQPLKDTVKATYDNEVKVVIPEWKAKQEAEIEAKRKED